MEMRYKLLGGSGLKVSEISLGTMTFGEDWGFGASAEACRGILEAYRARGGNFIDTANKYTNGSAERIVGELVRGDRGAWVIATKYSLSMNDADPSASGNGRKNLVQSVEASLKRLGTDYIDLLWVHAWDWTTPEAELMRALDDVVRAGKVLYVGMSDAPAWVVSRANAIAELRGWSQFVGIEIEYSLIERTVERELVPMASRLGLGVLAWAPMAGGVLTGKYTRGGGNDAARAAMNQGRLDERGLRVARAVDAVAEELGCSSAQVALAWLRSRPAQVIPIIGARKPEQMQDCLGCLDVVLPAAALERLDAASRVPLGFPYEFLGTPGTERVVYGATAARLDVPNPVRRLASGG
ncbi:aldo/keto reductase [Sorangium sp. So ce448]